MYRFLILLSMGGQIKNFCSGIFLPVDRCRITFWYIFLTFDRDIVFRDKLVRQKLFEVFSFSFSLDLFFLAYLQTIFNFM